MAGLGVLEVNDANFDQEVLRSEQPVLVDFWAVWCGPCKAIAPIVDGVAATYAGKLKVAKVNVDQNGATPSRYGIRGIPALLFFKGGKVADQIVGYVPQDVIEEKVKRLIGVSESSEQGESPAGAGLSCVWMVSDAAAAELNDAPPVALGWAALGQPDELLACFAFLGEVEARFAARIGFAVERLSDGGGPAHRADEQDFDLEDATLVLDA